MTCIIWKLETGEKLFQFPHTGPVRGIEFAEGGKLFATICDPFRGTPSRVSVYEFSGNPADQLMEPKYVWDPPIEQGKKLSQITWLPLNKNLLVCDDQGVMRLHEVETGRVVQEIREHTKRINDLSWSKEKFLLITGSADNRAILWDTTDWVPLKTYETDRPVNAVAISPIKEHVFVAGGQEAMSVTTTSAKVGKFETKIFHMVFGEEFGNVRGHFGPVNCLDIHPAGIG